MTIDCGNEKFQLAEILPENVESSNSDCSLFAATVYVVEARSARQICAVNPVIREADINKAMIIGNKLLRCERELAIPASIINVENGCCSLWVTNFSRRNQLIPKGMNIASLATIDDNSICSLNDRGQEGSGVHKSRNRVSRDK